MWLVGMRSLRNKDSTYKSTDGGYPNSSVPTNTTRILRQFRCMLCRVPTNRRAVSAIFAANSTDGAAFVHRCGPFGDSWYVL